jgi:Zn-dependent protease
LAEWWRTAPGLAAIIGWCAKLLRTRILDGARVMLVRDAATFEVPLGILNGEVQRRLLPQIEALRILGFGEPRVMRVTDVFTNREIVLVAQLHNSGRTVSRIVHAYPLSGATTKKKTLSVGFLSTFADGRLLCTDETRPKFSSAPTVIARWKRGGLANRYAAHEKFIGQLTDASVSPVNAENIWRIGDDYENALANSNLSRGLYVPLTSAEGANVAAISSPEESRRAAALAELFRLQTARPRSIGGVVLLVLSLLIFAGTGVLAWSWQMCATIGIALLVHEAGHYAAMRFFRYRDLRMFFIPLLGAAVTGKHHNVAGWKKAIVSLMGPLPGIVLGAGLGITAAVLGESNLARIAMTVIGINLFNLLPVLPLDGGWFWNAVLFCRHRWLEAGFKSLAGFALMVGVFLGGGGFLGYLGFVMLKGVPRTLRLGGAAERLRARGWQAGAHNTVSPEVADTILTELKQPGKNPPAAKTAAAEALEVFEHLNARPPKLFASFGLAASYAFAIIVAIIGLGAGASVHDRSSSKAVAETEAARREHPPVLSANFHGEIEQLPASTSDFDNSRSSRRVITTFPDADSASAAFAKIQPDQASIERVLQFGQTVIVVTPLKDNQVARELAERLRQNGGQVIDTGAPLTWMQFDLQFSSRDAEAAGLMHRELQTFFALPEDLRPAAPWLADTSLKSEQRETFLRAATTYARVLEAQSLSLANPEFERLLHVNLFSLFRSRKAVTNDVQAIRTKREQLAREAIKKLRTSGDPTLDQRVLTLALRQPGAIRTAAQMEAHEKWRAELRELFGAANHDTSEAGAGYINGTASITGNRITLHFLTFQYPEQTLPALARYLVNSNCDEIRYGFSNAEVFHSTRLAALDR